MDAKSDTAKRCRSACLLLIHSRGHTNLESPAGGVKAARSIIAVFQSALCNE